MNRIEILLMIRYLSSAILRAESQGIENTTKFLTAELEMFMDKLDKLGGD